MSVFFYEENDAGWAYSGFATVDVNSINSGSRAVRSTVNADTATFTFASSSNVPTNGVHAIYLGHQAAQDYGEFTYTVTGGGLNFSGRASQVMSQQISAGSYNGRVITPLWRHPDGIDLQNLVLTITNVGTTKCSVDFLVAMSHPRAALIRDMYTSFGDSWTVGTGPVQTWAAFAPQLTSILRVLKRRPITLNNLGKNGEALYARASTNIGAMFRTVQNDGALTALTSAPGEYMTVLFGANDFSNVTQNGSAWDFARQLATIMMMLEDAVDVDGRDENGGITPKWLFCTPPFLGPGALTAKFPTLATPTATMGRQNLETAAAITRLVVAQFPWATLCDVFAALDYRSTLLTVNSASDLGLHPNDVGTSALIAAMLQSFLQRIG